MQRNNPQNPGGPLGEERPQPHDFNAEKSVLAAMMREPGRSVDIVIEHLGEDPGVFYSHIHREIFEAILEAKKTPDLAGDELGVLHVLNRRGSLERVGGEAYLAEIYSHIATTVYLESWCNIVRDNAALRKMSGVCAEGYIKCHDADASPVEIIEHIERKVFEVRNSSEKTDILPFNKNLEKAFENIGRIMRGEIKPGIMTGFKRLDELTGGLKPGEMFVLAARPSIGKTAIALNIVRNITMGADNASVLFFSLEMSAEQLSRRLLCTESEVPESAFMPQDSGVKTALPDIRKLTTAVTNIRDMKLFIDPTPSLTIGAMSARAKRMKMKENIDLVVIDYLQLMKAGGKFDSRQNEVAEISGGVKRLAKELNIPVLVLAQLNREVDKNASPDALPKLSHLRESGAIEQDADIVVFLHRDRDKSKDVKDEDAAKGVDAKLIVEKNRNGRTGLVHLKFYGNRMLFGTAAQYDGEPPPAIAKATEKRKPATPVAPVKPPEPQPAIESPEPEPEDMFQ